MDVISPEDTHSPVRRWKPPVLALLLPVIAVGCLIAFVKAQETLSRYPFLRGSAMLVDRQVDIGLYGLSGGASSKAPAMRYRVYNIPESPEKILPAVRRDLAADGWREMKSTRTTRYWLFIRDLSPSPSGAPSPGASSVYLMPGRAVLLPNGANSDVRQTAEECTAVVATEEYKPVWFQAVYDRITGVKPTWVGNVQVHIVPPPARRP